jgi:hypothetical protein
MALHVLETRQSFDQRLVGYFGALLNLWSVLNVSRNHPQAFSSLGVSCFLFISLLHIAPFCEGPNKKPEGFAKEKQPAIFAMRHASHLLVHHPSLIYTIPYNHRSTFVTYTTKKILRPAQSPSTLAIFHISQRLVILKTSHILRYKTYCWKLWESQEIASLRYSTPCILRLNMYRKPHHKFLRNFPMVDVSQVAMRISSQINEKVTGEGSFAKGFIISFDLSRPFLSCKKSRWHWGSTCSSAKDSSTKFPEGWCVVQRAYLQNYKGWNSYEQFHCVRIPLAFAISSGESSGGTRGLVETQRRSRNSVRVDSRSRDFCSDLGFWRFGVLAFWRFGFRVLKPLCVQRFQLWPKIWRPYLHPC